MAATLIQCAKEQQRSVFRKSDSSIWRQLYEPEVKVKGKVVCIIFVTEAPRHEGILGVWRYSFTHSLTSALDGGK
jgi:hypothetical protein